MKYYFLLSKLRVVLRNGVENARLVGTVDRVDDIKDVMQLDFNLSRTDTAIAIAETFHLCSTPSLRG